MIDFNKIGLTKGTRYVHELWTILSANKLTLGRKACQEMSDYLRFILSLFLKLNKWLQIAISLFSNPASSERFNLKNNEVIKSASIYSLIGNKIKNLNVADTNKIPIDDLAKGTYIVKIESDRNTCYTSTFVKK